MFFKNIFSSVTASCTAYRPLACGVKRKHINVSSGQSRASSRGFLTAPSSGNHWSEMCSRTLASWHGANVAEGLTGKKFKSVPQIPVPVSVLKDSFQREILKLIQKSEPS